MPTTDQDKRFTIRNAYGQYCTKIDRFGCNHRLWGPAEKALRLTRDVAAVWAPVWAPYGRVGAEVVVHPAEQLTVNGVDVPVDPESFKVDMGDKIEIQVARKPSNTYEYVGAMGVRIELFSEPYANHVVIRREGPNGEPDNAWVTLSRAAQLAEEPSGVARRVKGIGVSAEPLHRTVYGPDMSGDDVCADATPTFKPWSPR